MVDNGRSENQTLEEQLLQVLVTGSSKPSTLKFRRSPRSSRVSVATTPRFKHKIVGAKARQSRAALHDILLLCSRLHDQSKTLS
jgi:hypothetical protein